MTTPERDLDPRLEVTVVIPAYNRVGSVGRAVASALCQEPIPPAEVLVVDDCSTDDTAAIAEQAGAHVVRHEANRGAGEARNTAVGRASQPWVAFLDSDDEWLPNHLDSLWPHRHGHVLLAGAALRCEPSGRERYLGPVEPGGRLLRSPAEIATLPIIVASGVVARREVVEEVGGFRPLHGVEDIDLWLRLLEHGTGYASPTVSVLYHVHGQFSDAGLQLHAGRRDVLTSYASRPWFDDVLVRDWDTAMTWDAARLAQREGDLGTAARRMAWIAASPARVRALLAVLRFRWRGRRRSSQVARSGAPTLAVMDADANARIRAAQRAPGYEVVVPPGSTRLARCASLARRPAAALLVDGRAGRLMARLLGIRPIAG